MDAQTSTRDHSVGTVFVERIDHVALELNSRRIAAIIIRRFVWIKGTQKSALWIIVTRTKE